MSLKDEMEALAKKADVEFEHVEAVVKRVLAKLHMDVENDAANAKKHIEELAQAAGRHDVVLPPNPSPAAPEAATATEAAKTVAE